MHHARLVVITIVLVIILTIIYTHNNNWTFEYPFIIGVLTNFLVFLIAKEMKYLDII
jgi:hypothetical protein